MLDKFRRRPGRILVPAIVLVFTAETADPLHHQVAYLLEVLPGGVFSINTEKVDRAGLASRLKEIYDPRPEKIIFVKGHPEVKFQDVIEAMDIARGAGVKVIGVPPKDVPRDAAASTTGGGSR